MAAPLQLLLRATTLAGACSAAAAAAAFGSITQPNTSLATIPVAYFGGTSAKRPHSNVEMLAKMRIVMVEKWEGHCWADCLRNSTVRPFQPRISITLNSWYVLSWFLGCKFTV